ncbi:MAG: hypothetical protein K1X57_16920 [Gemmataceae bacterium]|nr:hypothetical protein [Gemmataceae bacterium]
MPTSIFLDFNLPNATTWFYLSVMLAVAMFFQFARPLCLRNWDLLMLFVLVPGLLLVHEGHDRRREARQLFDAAARLHILPSGEGGAELAAALLEGPAQQRLTYARSLMGVGYQWLIIGSAYWILRCLVDLVLLRRPVMQPNLTSGALAWFAVSLFLAIGAVAMRRPPPDEGRIGPPGTVLQEATNRAEIVVRQTYGESDRKLVRWWVERTLAGACHLSVIAALVFIGTAHFGSIAAGVAAAAAYMVLPYLAFHMTQVHHVLPTAILLWAVAFYRQPRVAGVLIGVAAGAFGFPALVAPVWMSFYRGRGLGKFLTGFAIAAGIALAIAGLVLWLNGLFDLQIPTTMGLPQWQKWRVREEPNAEGFWAYVYWPYRIPVFIGATAFVLITAVWPQPKDLGNVIALSAAHLLAVQLWYADRGGVYVLWYLPLVILMVFRPSLYDRMPPETAVPTPAV